MSTKIKPFRPDDLSTSELDKLGIRIVPKHGYIIRHVYGRDGQSIEMSLEVTDERGAECMVWVYLASLETCLSEVPKMNLSKAVVYDEKYLRFRLMQSVAVRTVSGGKIDCYTDGDSFDDLVLVFQMFPVKNAEDLGIFMKAVHSFLDIAREPRFQAEIERQTEWVYSACAKFASR